MPTSDRDDRLSLRPKDKIRKRAEYLRIQGTGKKIVSPNFLAFVLRTERPPPPRIGITVSGKVGGAVVRNRVKRLVRETFRKQKGSLSRGCDLVIVAKARAAEASYCEVAEEVAEICSRADRMS